MNKTARALEYEFASKIGQANINISLFKHGEILSKHQMREIFDAFEMLQGHYAYLVEQHY